MTPTPPTAAPDLDEAALAEMHERAARAEDAARAFGYFSDLRGLVVGHYQQDVATLIASHRALSARVAALEGALMTIAEGDMPPDWDPGNIAWWLRGVARKTLRLPGWTEDRDPTGAADATDGGRDAI